MKQFVFTKPAIKTYNGIPGVYGLIYNNEIIYVGQSVNLGKRLKEHRREKALQQIIAKSKKEPRCNYTKAISMYKFIDKHREEMFFTIFAETANLDEVEKKYITEYQPRFNYKGVDVPY